MTELTPTQAWAWLRRQDNAEELLAVLDNYIVQTKKGTQAVVVPRDYANLEPLIALFGKADALEAYLDALQVMYKFLKTKEAHEIYRKVLTRASQTQRRKRLLQMVRLLEKQRGCKWTSGERAMIQQRLSEVMKLKRQAAVAAHRKATKSGALSQEQIEDIHETYYRWVQGNLDNGIIALAETPEETADLLRRLTGGV